MQIPFLNLASQYASIKNEIDDAIQRVLSTGPLVGGEFVKSFERNFAGYHGVKHCISTGNGTDSLLASLKMIGIKPGDEVITPAWSWISTSETITATGAVPVFADVDPSTFTLSILDIKKKITSRTKAIVAVHLYGQCCSLGEIKEICSQRDLILIEDCAQAHGAKHNNSLAGTFGLVSSFSFYPTKNLGAVGDAGCMLTNDDELALKLRRLVNHGGLSKDEHIFEGMNSRMDAIQAAVLNVKLQYLDDWNEKRRSIANVYHSQLKELDTIQLPHVHTGNEHVYHLFVIRSKKRDALKAYLQSRGVETMIHYPTALPFEPAYSRFNFEPKDFSIAFQFQQEVLSLPCNPLMRIEEAKYICSCLKDWTNR